MVSSGAPGSGPGSGQRGTLDRLSEAAESAPDCLLSRPHGGLLPVLVGCSDRNVSQPADVAKGYFAEGVDFVAANAVVGRRRLPSATTWRWDPAIRWASARPSVC